jgi:hypothetical protein
MKEHDAANRIYQIIVNGGPRPRIPLILFCGYLLFIMVLIIAYSVVHDGLYESIPLALILVSLFGGLGMMASSISVAIDILMGRRAIASLFLSNGEPLYRLIGGPRLPVNSVLKDSGMVFAIGYFLKKMGYENKASEIIDVAIAANPKLKSISVPETNLFLEEHDLHVVLEGLNEKASRSRLLRMWSNTQVRKVMIGGVIAILALQFLVQLINIFFRFR